ncbi:MAG: hypothetical protein PF692_09195, partial [Kiritimatiellae bacterium]|nr:hypothetical protein [Kiritimatiellia bacterium]
IEPSAVGDSACEIEFYKDGQIGLELIDVYNSENSKYKRSERLTTSYFPRITAGVASVPYCDSCQLLFNKKRKNYCIFTRFII